MKAGNYQASERALALMESSVVLDTHSHFLLNGHYFKKDFGKRHKPPWLWNPLRNTIDLPRLRDGRVSCSTCTVYVPAPPLRITAWAACNRVLDTLDSTAQKFEGQVQKVDSAKGIRDALSRGVVALLPAVEGGHVIGSKAERIRLLRQRGVRLLTLTHFIPNRIADAAAKPHVHGGISEFGRRVLKECEQWGVVADLAHCSDQAFVQALELLDKPPVVTHTALRQGRSSQRFITEDLLKLIAQKGGAVGVILWPWYLKRFSVFGGLDVVVDTYARMADLVGTQHLLLGSDLDGFTWAPNDMKEVSRLPMLTEALLSKGFSSDEVRDILGRNALRVLKQWE